jgi:hypothetical protein
MNKEKFIKINNRIDNHGKTRERERAEEEHQMLEVGLVVIHICG